MKLHWQILLANFVISFLIAGLVVASGGVSLITFVAILGIVGLVIGLLDIVIAIFLFIAGSNDWGQGFLLTGAILLLLGFTLCTGWHY
jgi:hypothetical protein